MKTMYFCDDAARIVRLALRARGRHLEKSIDQLELDIVKSKTANWNPNLIKVYEDHLAGLREDRRITEEIMEELQTKPKIQEEFLL